MIAAGKLNRRVEIQQPTISRDAVGGKVEGWSTLATVWAEVRDLRGRESFAAQAAGSAVSKMVTIRYLSTLDAKFRVRFDDGKVARIDHIEQLGRKEGQIIYCEMVNG